MAYFNKDNRSGGNRNFGSKSYGNDRPELFSATCANCGKLCEVPFRPTGSKPVFCRDCFKNQEGSDSRGSDRRSDNRSSGRSNSGDREMFDAVCSNCGKDCQIPFRPSQGRDVFCSRCFDTNQGGESHRPERRNFDKPSFNRDSRDTGASRGRTNDAPNYKAQFEALNAKMDKILALLAPQPKAVESLESMIDQNIIEEIVADIQEEKAETVEKKPKKAKAAAKKAPAKTKTVAEKLPTKAKKGAAPKKK